MKINSGIGTIFVIGMLVIKYGTTVTIFRVQGASQRNDSTAFLMQCDKDALDASM